MIKCKPLKFLFIYIAFVIYSYSVSAQCATAINTNSSPYLEDFEANNGGWTTGGTLSDWTWGTPTKATINNAGSGNKCWVTGGLSGNSYNSNELSWLQSPCFNFSTTPHPYVKFKVFWETEKNWDGATLQYSTDIGATWTNVGSMSDPADCLNGNWFNNASVTWLTTPLVTVKNGWSGSISTSCSSSGGSGTWVTAQHCMPFLGGKPKVIFRFVFGSGNSCNNFDGFAIDSFSIREAPSIGANYTRTCLGFNTVGFTNLSSNCPNTFSWNFGDPASGANNTSSLENPVHTFSAPGTYSVVMDVSNSSNNNFPGSATQSVTIPGLTASIISPVKCVGDNNGSVSVAVTGVAGTYSYTWNTTPIQHTQTISNLSPGTYTVTVTGTDICPRDTSITLVAPVPMATPIPTITQPTCNSATGTITITNTTPGFVYSFDNGANFQVSATSPALPTGTYQVLVKNANDCLSPVISVTLDPQPPTPPSPATSTIQPVCSTGTITVTNTSAGYTYSFDNGVNFQSSATSAALPTGIYQVIIKDAAGCLSPAVPVTLNAPAGSPAPPATSVQQPTCTAANGTITVTSVAAGLSYSFDNGANFQAGVTSVPLSPGTYNVVVKNAAGCVSAATPTIINAPASAPSAPTISITQPDCTTATGVITVTSVAAGLSYSFDNGVSFQSSPISISLTPNTYQAVVKNGAGCISAATPAVINTQPATPSVPTISITQPDCTTATGVITVTSVAAGLSYSFDNGVSFQSSPISISLTPNTYQAVVKNGAGCISAATPAVINTQPATPSVPTISITQPDCTTATGVITVTSVAAGLSYSFDNGVSFQLSPISISLTPNTYQAVVKNGAGCISAATPAVINTQPATPSAPTISITQPDCTTATGVITVTSVAAGLSYSFDNGVSFQLSPISISLTPNTYQAVVKNGAGCISAATPAVINTQPATPSAPTISITQPDCTTVTGVITVTSVAAGLSYSFDNGVSFQLSPISTSLTPNTYQAVVKNGVGCISAATPAVINTQPAIPAAPGVTGSLSYCLNTSAAPLTATGNNLLWYATATGGPASVIAPVPSTTTIGSNIYYVSQSTGQCEGPRASITVTVNDIPPAPLSTPVNYCQYSTAMPLTATGTALLWYTTATGGTGRSTLVPTTNAVGSGIYYVSQTITGCEGPRAPLTVTIISAPDLGVDKKDTVCFGGFVNLVSQFDTTGFVSWTLNEATVTKPDSVTASGTYMLRVKNNSGCGDSAIVFVTVLPKVIAFAGNDTTAIIDGPTQLHASGAGVGGSYNWISWNPLNAIVPDRNIADPIVTLHDFHYVFMVEVKDVFGCADTATVNITVLEGPNYYVPTAFTPDANGLNDVFRPIPVGVVSTDWFKVFNRYGEEIFTTKKWLEGWDGTYKGSKQPMGTYVWIIQGKDKHGRVIQMKGTVVLLR